MSCNFELGFEDYPLPHPRRFRGLSLYSPGGSWRYKALSGIDDALGFFDAITAQQALQQAISSSGVNPGTIPQQTQGYILNAIAKGQLVDQYGNPAYIPGTAECSATGISGAARDVGLAGTAGALVLEGVKVAGVAVSGALTLGISIAIASIVGLFSTILTHHAQAVKKEQNALCSAVPAANNYLKLIEQAVANGQATPQQGIEALQSLAGDFDNAVSSIRKMGGGSCNAACVMTEMLRGIVAELSSQYQDMVNATPPPAPVQQATAVTPVSVPTVSKPATVAPPGPVSTAPSSYSSFYSNTAIPSVSSASLPSWLPLAAIAFGAYLLLER